MRIPYALRRIPEASLSRLLPRPETWRTGDVALARLEKIGKNTRYELSNGRICTLHEGDLLAVVFGNRYATQQFEGYARTDGDRCDLLSMAGLCGLVVSRHASIAEPSKLRLLGALGDGRGAPLRLGDHALPASDSGIRPNVVVVCGTSMDAGKTHTAMSLIRGLRHATTDVAAAKLTGTAAGRDTWCMLDAGACVALDFIDGGFASTYRCSLDDLLDLHERLTSHAASRGAGWLVVEIADGLLQAETAALLQSPRFTSTVDAWVFAAGDPLGAVAGTRLLGDWGIEPVAISGLLTMSPLGIREAEQATGVPCMTAQALQRGELNAKLLATVSPAPAVTGVSRLANCEPSAKVEVA